MKLSFGGKDFELKTLCINDWIALEDKGIDLQELGQKDKNGQVKMNLKTVRSLVWLVLHRVDNTVTEEWVGENLDHTSPEFKAVMETVTSFLSPTQESLEPTT
jgi:hypothetical protein